MGDASRSDRRACDERETGAGNGERAPPRGRGIDSLKNRIAFASLSVAAVTAGLAWLVLSDDGGPVPQPARAASLDHGDDGSAPTAAGETVARSPTRRHVVPEGEEGSSPRESWLEYPDLDDESLAAWVYRYCGPGYERYNRDRAFKELASRPAGDVIPALLRVVARDDLEWWWSESALGLIAEFGPGAAPWIDDVVPHVTGEWRFAPFAILALTRMGTPGLPHLLDALADDDPRVRRRALWGLSEFEGRDPRILSAAIALLYDDDVSVRSDAIGVVSVRKEDVAASVAALLPLMDGDEPTRVSVIQAFGHMGDAASPAAIVLIEVLSRGTPTERIAAAEALGEFPSVARASVPALLALIDSAPERYAYAAASAIAQISRGGFTAGLGASNPDVRVAFMKRMEIHVAHFPAAEEDVATALAGSLPEGGPLARAAAFRVLATTKMDVSAVVPALRRIVEEVGDAADRHAPARLVAKLGTRSEGAEDLVTVLSVGTAADRARALHDLGKFGRGAAPAIPAMRELLTLSEIDSAQRVGALYVLEVIGPAARVALPDVRAFLASPDDVVRLHAALAVLAIDPPGTEVTDLLTSYRTHGLRQRLVAGLARNPQPRFAPLLADRIDDRDVRIGRSAAIALAAIGDASVAPLVARFDGTNGDVARASFIRALQGLGVAGRKGLSQVARRDDLSARTTTEIETALEAHR